jgi:hydrogenase maturation protein HypF
VFIEVCGPADEIESFVHRLLTETPPLAVVEHVERRPAVPSAADEFVIVESRTTVGERTLVSPDTAVCADCLAEFRDPTDRRYRHPFVNCTNCGPRFTIIRSLPYDRAATTMASFPMCPQCSAEYTDPADRRYHAQPISCHDCGPVLTYSPATAAGDRRDGTGPPGRPSNSPAGAGRRRDGRRQGARRIPSRSDATSDEAVGRLRSRKHRPDKPFAIMVRDLAQAAREFAEISGAEALLLQSPARPIVLLQALRSTALSALGGARQPADRDHAALHAGAVPAPRKHRCPRW